MPFNHRIFFSEYDSLLTEALNSPAEFYMTADTKLPMAIYATCSVDDKPYTFALVETAAEGVYVLEIGRAKEKNTVWWRFHDPKHIPIILSTVVKFVESSIAFLSGRLKGIAIKFRASASMKIDKAQRIIERLVKRSYLTTLKYYPVTQPEEKQTKYIFIAKKTASPSVLFKSKAFKDHDFIGDGPIPADAIADLSPKLPIKKTTTLKPLTTEKYGMEVKTISTQELLDKVNNVKVIKKGKKVPLTLEQKADQMKNEYQNAFQVVLSLKAFKPVFTALEKEADYFKGLGVSLLALKAIVKKKLSDGLYAKNMDFSDKYELQLLTKLSNRFSDAILISAISTVFIDRLGIKIDNYIVKDQLDTSKEAVPQLNAKLKELEKQKTDIGSNRIQSDIDLAELTSPISPMASYPPENTIDRFESTNTKTDAEIIGFYDKSKLLEIRHKNSAAYDYTGYAHELFNKSMVGAANFIVDNQDKEVDIEYKNEVLSLLSIFDEIEPSPEPMWVYRGIKVSQELLDSIKPIYEFVDPRFLSTSISPSTSYTGNIYFRIYVPKGSPVIPCLTDTFSKNSDEREILLPPFSMIKIVEMEEREKYGTIKVFLTGIYVGTAYQAFREKIKQPTSFGLAAESIIRRILAESESTQKGSEKEYDSSGKFSSTYDVKIADKIKKLIEKSKLSIRKPK